MSELIALKVTDIDSKSMRLLVRDGKGGKGFATHLLEDGVGLLRIKELLGHRCISSTTIYLHIADVADGVVSPADKIDIRRKETFEDYPL